ncbi:MAG: methyl-accepting chemotaxis protein [Roseibium sp.]
MLLRYRIVVAFAFAIACVFSGFIYSGHLTQQQMQQASDVVKANGTRSLVSAVLAQHEQRFRANAKQITRNRDGLAALAGADADAVREEFGSSFNRVSATGELDRMVLRNLDGSTFVILGENQEKTSSMNAMLDEVLAQKNTLYGIVDDGERGASMGLAFPVYKGRDVTGVAMFTRTIASDLEQIAKTENGAAILVADGSVVSVAGEFLLENENLQRDAASQSPGVVLVSEAERHYDVIADQLQTYSGAQAATVVVVKDVTENVNALRTFEARNRMVIGGFALAFLVFSLIWLKWQLSPLEKAIGALQKISSGEYDVDVTGDKRGDEIGAIARAVITLRSSLKEADMAKAEQEHREAVQAEEAEQQRQMLMRELGNELRGAIGSSIEVLEQGAGVLDEAANSLISVSNNTSNIVGQTASTSESASVNVQTVASAAEELSTSISQIDVEVTKTGEIVEAANNAARETSDKVENLAAAATRIGEVVSLIKDIAEQTNLLALNATIEAARAGDMGKGFAVVASEVKQLATQTGKATEEIEKNIIEIQQSTGAAVDGIQQISTTMEDANIHTVSITAAINQQGSASMEISQNIQKAAEGTRHVADNVASVTQAVGETSDNARRVEQASADVSLQAQKMRQTIDDFLSNIEAA